MLIVKHLHIHKIIAYLHMQVFSQPEYLTDRYHPAVIDLAFGFPLATVVPYGDS